MRTLAARADPRTWNARWSAYALAALIGVSVVRFQPPRYVLEPYINYSDHLRHAYSAWAFLHIGFRIFTTALGDWHVHSSAPHAFWTNLPEYYPPGLIIAFMPFGLAANLGWLSDPHVNMLMVALLGAAAVLASFALVRAFRLLYEPALGLVLSVVGVVLFVTWGLDGFIDPLAAGLAAAGIYWAARDEPGRGLVLLSLALSLHFRLWYLWPFAIAVAVRNRRRISRRALVASALILGASVIVFLLSAPAVSKLGRTPGRDQNYLALANGMNGERAVAIAGAAALLVVVWLSERDLAPLACVALVVGLIFGVNQWEAWYTVLLFPLFLVVRSRISQGVLAFAFLQIAWILGGGFPSVIRAVHLYYLAVR